jgi:hypothetical protein
VSDFLKQFRYNRASFFRTLPGGGALSYKSGYPADISPFSYFFWVQEKGNYNESTGGYVFKVRYEMYLVSLGILDEPAVSGNVISQVCDFNYTAEQSTDYAIYSPSTFEITGVGGLNPPFLPTIAEADVTLPGEYVEPPKLTYRFGPKSFMAFEGSGVVLVPD